MNKEIELLAPGGDVESIKAAILAGANAVYCGLDNFNARNRAVNISFDNLKGILRLAHKHNCEVFLTLNVIIVENEVPAFIAMLKKLVRTSIDGVIVQDIGMFHLISSHFPSLDIHASTQTTTHNEGQIKFLRKLAATRVNLSRELNLDEIRDLTNVAHENNVLTEVFVHGSNCVSYSGACYISSVQAGNSGNKGRCSQECRSEYLKTPEGTKFPMNLKDSSAYFDLEELAQAGVDSLKIEGRIKTYDYVYTVVDSWRKNLDSYYTTNKMANDSSPLYKVFNRGLSNGFLKGHVGKDTFSDNPRDNSAIHLAGLSGGTSKESIDSARKEINDERVEITGDVKTSIDQFCIDQAPINISITGVSGAPLTITVTTPDTSFSLHSDSDLRVVAQNQAESSKKPQGLDRDTFQARFKAINDTAYHIDTLDVAELEPDLMVPFKELTSIKKQILNRLNDSKEIPIEAEVPRIKQSKSLDTKPTLSVLISSPKDLHLCAQTTADIYFQLPSDLKKERQKLLEMFQDNTSLIPWFPAILTGHEFHGAVDFLEELKPALIATNNTGIAFEACEKGIPWIAGPYLNLVNSYSLIALQEKFNCVGGFISNEINKNQLKTIRVRQDFKAMYSIYHPIMVMINKQCLFLQTTGCHKTKIDETCIATCAKKTTITDLNKNELFIEKSKGNYHHIYNEDNFLNTDIITDIPNRFASFFIDLRDIKTNTTVEVDKLAFVKLFEGHLAGDIEATKKIHQAVTTSTNRQYQKGI